MDFRVLMTLQAAVGGAQTSGHFEGPRLRGQVLPGGGDFGRSSVETASSSSTCVSLWRPTTAH
jgi:hypothetical protein